MHDDGVLGGVRPCSGLLELFFSGEPGDVDMAKAVCATCAATTACLTVATKRREAAGVWGGHLFRDGEIVPVVRRRGRPAKAA